MGDSRKLFEYFATFGLSDGAEELALSAQECNSRNSASLAPITDICVIFPDLGEEVPEGFECIENTPLGYPADLNHGSLRTHPVFVCYRRGYHKPPLVDIGMQFICKENGVLDEGRGEKPMLDSNIVQTTPFGRPANVNNASQGVYLTYRRAQPNSAPSQLVVTHICVIIANKGEVAPHTYYKIPKNLNKGMVGSDVYLCYKKSQGVCKRIAYKPEVLNVFPDDGKFQVDQNLPMLCLPMGALVECWPAKCQPPDKTFLTFVLTEKNGCRFYGAAVSFYERYKKKLTEEQLEKLEILSAANGNISGLSGETGRDSAPSQEMYEVSFPSPRCPRVLVQLGNETISLESYEDSQLPLSGASFFDALKSLGPENLIYIVLLALLEQKILVHSLQPWLLTAVAESVCALMFPFHWQCPYIPQCPLTFALAGGLNSPVPLIAGVDSRYFDLYEDLPQDLTCFDLDTATIRFAIDEKAPKLSLLPKRLFRQLRTSLEKLQQRLHQEESNIIALRKNAEFAPIDVDFQIQRNRHMLEVEIQDAFLKFMASLMQGYTHFLRPIRSAPRQIGATDIGSLFDVDAFLRSRDRSSTEFFVRFCETQMFNRFIEERSFVSDKNAFNAFFDDCITRVSLSGTKGPDIRLLDAGLPASSQTEFTMPPEPFKDQDGNEMTFTYEQFPRTLNPAFFQLDKLRRYTERSSTPNTDASPVGGINSALHRTKQEWRNSIDAAAISVRYCPFSWPRVILFYAYSLWFMLLPSLLHLAISKTKMLRLAFHVLDRMEQCGILPFDQVCYRIVIQLCGEMQQPHLAVRVWQAMKRCGVEQNAVTYGIYHEAVLKPVWPTGSRLVAIKAWRRLALVIRGVAKFRANRLLGPFGQLSISEIRDNQNSTNESEEVKLDRSCCNSCSKGTGDGVEVQPPEDEAKQEEKSLKAEDSESFDQKSDVAPFVISVHPLATDSETSSVNQIDNDESSTNELMDPLGALSPEHTKAPEKKKNIATMSPSRIRFMKEHSVSPFTCEEFSTEKPKVKKSDKSSSWFKDLVVVKLMRNSSSGKFGSSDSLTESLPISPSLTSLVAHMKKGYDDVMQSGNFSSLREGVNTIVNEVKALNRSHARELFGSNPNIDLPEHDDVTQQQSESYDALFQLDSGSPCSILPTDWWVEDQFFASNSLSSPLDVAISSASLCVKCKAVVYDEDIMAGWSVDDSKLKTTCIYCDSDFVPRLSIRIRSRPSFIKNSWYTPSVFNTKDDFANGKQNDDRNEHAESSTDRMITIPFVSPLVLRREIESLLNGNPLSLAEPSLQQSHPIVFWNLVYYTRRIALPTHFCSWLGSSVHVRCVYDVPEAHSLCKPLYFSNQGLQEFKLPETTRSSSVWDKLIAYIKEPSILSCLQQLLREHRCVADGVKLRPHFSLYRDIQFVALNEFGKIVNRDRFDELYQTDFDRLPPRILAMLPKPDYPIGAMSRWCKKIFMPLDLYQRFCEVFCAEKRVEVSLCFGCLFGGKTGIVLCKKCIGNKDAAVFVQPRC